MGDSRVSRAERAGGAEWSFDYEDRQLAYEEYGEGDRVVVLLHGLLLDANVNRALGARLAEHGFRVLLLDLTGHGRSSRPPHASFHRVDRYAEEVVALLDELGVEKAVVGGVSLGANVGLYLGSRHPDRLCGLFLEMPVLEWATPAAVAIFLPLLLAFHYAEPVMRLTAAVARRLPMFGNEAFDTLRTAAAHEPDEAAAVLHGLMVGPLAPSIEERAEIRTPTLILGHTSDVLHPFNDASNLAEQLPNARLVRARSPFELRVRPERLTTVIADCFAEMWGRSRR